jgi:hypothetical protein
VAVLVLVLAWVASRLARWVIQPTLLQQTPVLVAVEPSRITQRVAQAAAER